MQKHTRDVRGYANQDILLNKAPFYICLPTKSVPVPSGHHHPVCSSAILTIFSNFAVLFILTVRKLMG